MGLLLLLLPMVITCRTTAFCHCCTPIWRNFFHTLQSQNSKNTNKKNRRFPIPKNSRRIIETEYLPVRRFRILSNFVLLLLLLLQLLLLWKLLEFLAVVVVVFICVPVPVDDVISWNAISYFGNWHRSISAAAEFIAVDGGGVCISHWSLNIFNIKSCACSMARFRDTSSNLVAVQLLSLFTAWPLFIKSLELFSLNLLLVVVVVVCCCASTVSFVAPVNLLNLFTLSLEHFTKFSSLSTSSSSSYLSLGRCE